VPAELEQCAGCRERICWAADSAAGRESDKAICIACGKFLTGYHTRLRQRLETGSNARNSGIRRCERISLATLLEICFRVPYAWPIPLAAALFGIPRRVTVFALNSRRLPNAPPIIVNKTVEVP